MNPAPSIIFFTVASGAGYGLLFWMGLLRPLGLVPQTAGFGVLTVGIALALTMLGLLSSTAHLGRPERAWRALSQWRSSWLSREGICAIATFAPAGLFFLALAGQSEWLALPTGLLAAAGAAVTVWCTGMIYASLPTIRQWHHPLVAPGYLLFGAFSGAALLATLAAFWGAAMAPAAIAAVLGAVAFVLKRAYWASVDAGPPLATMETATGLGFIGKVRVLDPPHTETNYLLREMAFRIGRVHAAKLRRIASVAGFAVPAALLLLALLTGGAFAGVFAVAAAALVTVGLLAERWLMFAEATHTVALYYGAGEHAP
ncbi:dimethyl sulfoxide reductase anchor subunit [Roseomonas terrae]|jgi:DMSO reductase anchor subunit|uniref:Dimethyl sulfoxide reductase anchor subunit n=1 Tax=Neoroseomonas terrae TaxID=424799 RepID=A0ABS5EFW7_9PROT|nr:DmsC/YnfH family molybdoenzyme membrane anchor subunit [Neoroseomonas terrae]MBR0649912.1 dimethyl sulfoxide reductase anchor subunit [Neoroseomonas terrae]